MTTVLIALCCALCLSAPVWAAMPDYSGCGTSSRCFGTPDKCVSSQNCDVLLKTKPVANSDVEFDLFWSRPATEKESWVSAALSSDGKMNGASAALFVIDSNNVTATQGETYVGATGAGFKPFDVKGITVNSKTYADSLLSAQWTRTATTTVDKTTFDLKTKNYYILLAYGPTVNGQIQHHTHAYVSDSAVNLETLQ